MTQKKTKNKLISSVEEKSNIKRGVRTPPLRNTIVSDLKPKKNENENELELIECIDFFEGKNKLTIRFSKKQNRMYRVQVFLNDEYEIRPVTYSGSSMGLSFWNLLKKAMNK